MQTIVSETLLNYEIIGKDNKKTLLILHGWGRSLAEWLPSAQALTDKYQVYILDLPGFGGSQLPDNPSIDIYWYADLVKKFIEKMKLKNLAILGHSFGGRISIILGADRKVSIDQLIFVSTAGVTTRSFVTKLKIIVFKTLKIFGVFLPPFLRRPFLQTFYTNYYQSEGVLREVFKTVVGQNLDAEATKIKSQTLIIWGEKDQEVPIKYAKKLKKLIPHATLRVVWATGHSPHIENSSRFQRILKEYL